MSKIYFANTDVLAAGEHVYLVYDLNCDLSFFKINYF